MRDSTGSTARALPGKSRQFNFSKLQAVLCMAASAAVSIALLAWAISAWS
ncbi:MAG: hypothetical protein Q7U14_00040 [Lacisediminimonas sp.]|nr:hypothetical protein [Lacisediminimonas sp.]